MAQKGLYDAWLDPKGLIDPGLAKRGQYDESVAYTVDTLPARVVATKRVQNWDHPLSRGLVAHLYGDDASRDRQLLRPTVVGNITRDNRLGNGWRNSYQASNNYIHLGRPSLPNNAVTLEVLVRVQAFQTNIYPYISGMLGGWQTDATFYPGPSLRFNATTALADAAKPALVLHQNGLVYYAQSSVDLVVGRVYHIAGTFDGSWLRLYVDGVQVASLNQVGTMNYHELTFFSALSDYVAAASLFNQNRCLNGIMPLARIYDRALSAREIVDLAKDPWQTVRAKRVKAPFVPSFVRAAGTLTGASSVAGSTLLNQELAGELPPLSSALAAGVEMHLPALVTRKKVLTAQPQGATEIDWSHPSTQGLLFALPGANDGGRDLVGGRVGTLYSPDVSAYQTVDAIGVNRFTGIGYSGHSGNSAASRVDFGAVNAGDPLSGYTTKAITVLAIAKRGTVISVSTNSAGAGGWIVQLNDDSYVYYSVDGVLSGALGMATSKGGAFAISFGESTALGVSDGAVRSEARAVTFPQGTGVHLAVNGLYSPTVSGAYTGSGVIMVAVWGRRMGAAEMRYLVDNPWALFKPARVARHINKAYLPVDVDIPGELALLLAASTFGGSGLGEAPNHPGLITSKQPWRQQPTGPVEIDPGYVHAEDITKAAAPWLGVLEVVSQRVMTPTFGGSLMASRAGLAFNGYVTKASYRDYSYPNRSAEGSLFWHGTLGGPSVDNGCLGAVTYNVGAATAPYCAMDFKTGVVASSYALRADYNIAGTQRILTLTGAPSAARLASLASSIKNGRQVFLGDLDGVVYSDLKTFAGDITYGAAPEFVLGQDHQTLSRYSNGAGALLIAFSRALSDDALRELMYNPWQVFRRRKKASYFWLPGAVQLPGTLAKRGPARRAAQYLGYAEQSQLDVLGNLTHRLQHVYMPRDGTVVDVLSPGESFTGGAVRRADSAGVGLFFDGASAILGNTTDGHYNRGFTALVVARPTALANYKVMFGSGFSGWDLRLNSAGKLCLAHSGSTIITTGLRTVVAGELVACLVSLTDDGASLMYINGALDTTDSISTTNFGDSTTPLTLGATLTSGGSPTSHFDGTIYLAALWDRALSAAECAEITANPLALFQPKKRVIPFGPEGESPVSISKAGLLEALLGSIDAGYIVTVSKGGELTGYVSLNAGHHVAVAVPGQLTGNVLLSGSSQIAVAVSGVLTANASPTAGHYVTVQVVGSLSAVTSILGTAVMVANVTVGGTLPAANGQVSGSFRVSVNQLSAVLTAISSISAGVQIAVSVPGSITGVSALSGGASVAVQVTGSVGAIAQLLGTARIDLILTGMLPAAAGQVTAGFIVSVNKLAGVLSALGSLSGQHQISVAVSGSHTALSALSGGSLITVQVTGALTAISSVLGTVAIGTGAVINGVMPAAHGQVTAGFQISPNNLVSTLTSLGSLAGQVQIAVAVPASLSGLGALSGGAAVAVQVTGTLTTLTSLLAGIKIDAALSGILPAANGQLTAGFIVAVNNLNATLTALGSLSGQVKIDVSTAGSLTGTGALSGTAAVGVQVAGSLSALSALFGTVAIGTGAVVSGVLPAVNGQLTAGFITSANNLNSVLTAIGSLSGQHQISVNVTHNLAATSSLSAGAAIGVIAPGLLTSAGILTGGSVVTVSVTGELSLVSSISAGISSSTGVVAAGLMPAADGSITAGFAISANQLNTVLPLLGALTAGVNVSVAVGDALWTSAQLQAAHFTSATITGQVYNAVGHLLGSVQASAGVNVGGTLQAGSVIISGQHIGVARPGVLDNAVSSIVGEFAEGRIISNAQLTGQTALSASSNIAVYVTGALTANTELAAALAQNVLIAADSFLAQGSLTGTIRILGPSHLTGIETNAANVSEILRLAGISTQLGVSGVSSVLALASVAGKLGVADVTPAYVVVSITPDDGVVLH